MAIFRELVRNRYLYLLGVPALVFQLVFALIPMLGHVIAFEDYSLLKGIFGSEFIGLENFSYFFQGQDWLRVTLNTFWLNSLFIFFSLLFGVLIALAINEMRGNFFKRLAQQAVFFPYFISWVVVSMLALMVLKSDGILNNVLASAGAQPVKWYQESALWPAILTIIDVWKFAGYNSIIFLATLVSISPELYESAQIDGASKFQQIRTITLPLLAPTVVTLVLLAVGRIFFGDFGMIYGIVGDQSLLYPTTDVIDTYSYRALRLMGDFGMSSAIVLYQGLMGIITVLVANWLIRRYQSESSLF